MPRGAPPGSQAEAGSHSATNGTTVIATVPATSPPPSSTFSPHGQCEARSAGSCSAAKITMVTVTTMLLNRVRSTWRRTDGRPAGAHWPPSRRRRRRVGAARTRAGTRRGGPGRRAPRSGVPIVSSRMIQVLATIPTRATTPMTTTPRVTSTEPSRRGIGHVDVAASRLCRGCRQAVRRSSARRTENSSPPARSSNRTFETSFARW